MMLFRFNESASIDGYEGHASLASIDVHAVIVSQPNQLNEAANDANVLTSRKNLDGAAPMFHEAVLELTTFS